MKGCRQSILQAKLAIIVLAMGSLSSAGSADLEKQLTAAYKGKVLTLRQFYEGSRLQFSSDGRLVGSAPVGSWTVDGQIEIREIHLQEQALQIRGRRLRLFFDPSNRQMVDTGEIHPDSPEAKLFGKFGDKSWKKFTESASVEVDLALASPPKDEKDIAQVLSKIFLFPADELADSVPACWKSFVLGQEGEPVPRGPITPSVFKVGGGVSPPRAQFTPDPEYSETARQAGYGGTTVLWLVVSPEGHAEDVRIVKPIGLGLDEKAVEAVRQWRFDPAHKDGAPVAVQINVEVTFRLY